MDNQIAQLPPSLYRLKHMRGYTCRKFFPDHLMS